MFYHLGTTAPYPVVKLVLNAKKYIRLTSSFMRDNKGARGESREGARSILKTESTESTDRDGMYAHPSFLPTSKRTQYPHQFDASRDAMAPLLPFTSPVLPTLVVGNTKARRQWSPFSVRYSPPKQSVVLTKTRTA